MVSGPGGTDGKRRVWRSIRTRSARAGALLQLCLDSDLLSEVQGELPERMHVVPPGVGFEPDSHRAQDYYRWVARHLVQAADAPLVADALPTYPESNRTLRDLLLESRLRSQAPRGRSSFACCWSEPVATARAGGPQHRAARGAGAISATHFQWRTAQLTPTLVKPTSSWQSLSSFGGRYVPLWRGFQRSSELRNWKERRLELGGDRGCSGCARGCINCTACNSSATVKAVAPLIQKAGYSREAAHPRMLAAEHEGDGYPGALLTCEARGQACASPWHGGC